jgi:hypothetical protein
MKLNINRQKNNIVAKSENNKEQANKTKINEQPKKDDSKKEDFLKNSAKAILKNKTNNTSKKIKDSSFYEDEIKIGFFDQNFYIANVFTQFYFFKPLSLFMLRYFYALNCFIQFDGSL